MKKIVILAALVSSLSGCVQQQTPEQFGAALGRDTVLKDNDGLCYSAGWNYEMSKDSPIDGERRQNAAELAIVRKELAFRQLKGDMTCAHRMEQGQREAALENAKTRAVRNEQAEQEARAARAAAY